MAAPRLSASLLFSLLLFLPITTVQGKNYGGIIEQAHPVSRELFRFKGDVAWIVQVSDFHISSYYPDRGEDLKRLLAPALRIIRPSLVLLTGDLTDAKNRDRTSTRQDKSEWIQYRKVMDAVIRESGMDKRAFFDIRGNHDKYGVPYVGGELDFFSNFSISSQLNRLNTIQSISLMGNNWTYVFLGVDDSMNIGLRGPSNLFGHPSEEGIEAVNSELQYWNSHTGAIATKIVFGHFPMSFIASSGKGNRYEDVFARQSVAAYLCGHLHAKFSKQLWRLHSIKLTSASKPKKLQQFWEWELGDWKESRLIRILSIDEGRVSFVDIELHDGEGSKQDIQTMILVTYPVDSRSMSRIGSHNLISRNDISALVFSAKPILNVTAKIFDSSRAFRLVEELPLYATSSAHNGPLFRSKWNTVNYKNASATRFWLQVLVVDIHGKETASKSMPFSVEGKLAHLPKTWLEHLIMHIRWENLYIVLLWGNISFLVLLLFLPKLLNHFMGRNASYQKWAMSVSVSLPVGQRRSFFWPLWFLIEGSRDRKLWCAMVMYLLFLLRFPWFCGNATSEDSEIACMSMNGWKVKSLDTSIMEDGIGIPDIMVITLPFMYIIVTPLYLMVYSLLAERSTFYLHSSRKSRCSQESTPPKKDLAQRVPPAGGTVSKSSNGLNLSPCKICRGWSRTALLLACFIIVYLHFRFSSFLMSSYGAVVVALSPGISWAPPLLLAAAIYSSQSPIRNNQVHL